MSLGAPGASVRAYLWTVYCPAMRGSDFLALFKSVLAILSENISNFLTWLATEQWTGWLCFENLKRTVKKLVFMAKKVLLNSAKRKKKVSWTGKSKGYHQCRPVRISVLRLLWSALFVVLEQFKLAHSEKISVCSGLVLNNESGIDIIETDSRPSSSALTESKFFFC